MKSEQAKINWEEFDIGDAEDRLKLEPGKTVRGIGFCSVEQDTLEVEDKEKTDQGTVPVKKKIPVLKLGIDYKEGKPVKMGFTVTSKRLAQDVRAYFEKGILFTRLFEITKDGTGMQTKYRLLAMEDKPPSREEKAGAFV